MLNADVKEFEFTSSFDELVISAVIAVPSGTPCGIAQIVHGMNEHKEMYFPFMDYLAGEGFITVIHDNRGHGRSITSPDDLGFMFRDGGEAFVSDIAQLTKITREAYPSLPYFMIGSGIGSLGARCFLRDHDDQIDGMVVLGCPCYSGFSGIVRAIESESSKKPGSRFRSDRIRDAFDSVLSKKFSGETQPFPWRSSEKVVTEAFAADPLCDFTYTLNGYENILWLLRETYSRHGWKVQNPHLPIRFISGRDDPCMISEKKFFKAVKRLEKTGYDSISHRLPDGMRHDILNGQNTAAVYKDIAKTLFSWIDRVNADLAETQG